jgi:hypothetical protein
LISISRHLDRIDRETSIGEKKRENIDTPTA